MAALVGATAALVAMALKPKLKVKVAMAVVSRLISPFGKYSLTIPAGGGYGGQGDYGTSMTSNTY